MTTSLAPAAVAWTPAASARPAPAVEAGTLLGVAGADARALAGDGVVAVLRAGGGAELRAGRDGVPARDGAVIAIVSLHVLDGAVDSPRHDLEVLGALPVAGHVWAGRRVGASGPVLVEGMIDRASVRAGAALVVEGRATGAELSAGATAAVRRDVAAALAGAPEDLSALVAQALQVAAAAVAREATVPAARAIAAVRDRRMTDLADRLRAAEALLAAARRGSPWVAPGLALALADAADVVAEPERLQDPLARVAATAGLMIAATAARPPAEAPGARLAAVRDCRVTCAGTLRLTGAGAVGCELAPGGDLLAMGPGGGLRGGSARVGGRLRAGELAPGGGRPLRIEMLDARPGRDRVRAELVHPGAEIRVAGQVVRFDSVRRDVRIGVEAGRAVVDAA